MTKVGALSALLCTLTLVLAGCDGPTAADENPGIPVSAYILIAPPPEPCVGEIACITLGQGISGRLGLIGGRCVGFVDKRAGSPETVILWPHGTTLRESEGVITIESQGKSVQVGDIIDGGTGPEGADRRTTRRYQKSLPEECRDADVAYVGLSE